jgi:hypothetical protein
VHRIGDEQAVGPFHPGHQLPVCAHVISKDAVMGIVANAVKTAVARTEFVFVEPDFFHLHSGYTLHSFYGGIQDAGRKAFGSPAGVDGKYVGHGFSPLTSLREPAALAGPTDCRR